MQVFLPTARRGGYVSDLYTYIYSSSPTFCAFRFTLLHRCSCASSMHWTSGALILLFWRINSVFFALNGNSNCSGALALALPCMIVEQYRWNKFMFTSKPETPAKMFFARKTNAAIVALQGNRYYTEYSRITHRQKGPPPNVVLNFWPLAWLHSSGLLLLLYSGRRLPSWQLLSRAPDLPVDDGRPPDRPKYWHLVGSKLLPYRKLKTNYYSSSVLSTIKIYAFLDMFLLS